jgi:RND family efflux transporter MFP subunit
MQRLTRKFIGLVLATAAFGQTAAAEPIAVQTQPFAALAVYPQLTAPATVVSDNDSRLSAEVSARIIDIPVQVGDRVEKGALLLRLERQDLALQLTRAQAALAALDARIDLARYELKRAQSLSSKKAISEQTLKQRESELATLVAEHKGQQAAVAQAQRAVDKTELRAPFNAIVMQRLGQIGELANPGTPLLRLLDAEHIEVSSPLQPAQVAALSDKGQAELFFVSDDQSYPLQLRLITPAMDSRSRTREARLRFSGPRPLPGSAGQLQWRQPTANLPADLISQRQGKLGVFTLQGKQAHFVALPQAEVGRPVIARLAPDTLIITEGRFSLRDGDPVRVK